MRNILLTLLTGLFLTVSGARAGTVNFFTNAFLCCDLASDPAASGGSSTYLPNGVYSTNSASGSGIYNSGLGSSDGLVTESLAVTADLANGFLHVASSGSVSGTDSVNAEAEGIMGDTFTNGGPLVGNMGVHINLDGSNYSSVVGNDLAFLVIDAVPTGTFGNGSPYANPMWGGYYILGDDSSDGSTGAFANLIQNFYGNPAFLGDIADTSGDSFTVPIPMSVLGSNFQLVFSLDSFMIGQVASGDSWNVNYGNTVGITLIPAPGDTLTSAGGFAGTQTTTPEPSTLVLLGGGLLALVARRARRRA